MPHVMATDEADLLFAGELVDERLRVNESHYVWCKFVSQV